MRLGNKIAKTLGGRIAGSAEGLILFIGSSTLAQDGAGPKAGDIIPGRYIDTFEAGGVIAALDNGIDVVAVAPDVQLGSVSSLVCRGYFIRRPPTRTRVRRLVV